MPATIPIRYLIAITTIASAFALASCDDPGEDVVDGERPSASAQLDTPTSPASPTDIGGPAGTVTVSSTPGTTQCAAENRDPRTLAPTPKGNTKSHLDFTSTYSVDYPEEWQVCQAQIDPQVPDLIDVTEFVAADGFSHVTVAVYDNPGSLSLEEWIVEHDPIFLDDESKLEDRVVAGRPAIFRATDPEAGGGAYVFAEERIIAIGAILVQEFESFVNKFTFNKQ